MNILAQTFGLIASVFLILSIQIKKRKDILTFLVLGNGFFVINFLLIGAYTGALISAIATVETIISYYYADKKMEIPKLIILLFITTSLIGGIISYKQLFDTIPIICAVLYTLIIIQKKEFSIRRMVLLLASMWIIYDLLVGAYTAIISDVFTLISTIIAIIRYDLKMIK